MADTKRDSATLVTLFPDTGRATPQSLRDLIVSVGWEGTSATQLKRVAIYSASFATGAATTLCTITIPTSVSGSFSARLRGTVQCTVNSGTAVSSMRFDYHMLGNRDNTGAAQAGLIEGSTSPAISSAAATVLIGSITPSLDTATARTFVVKLNIAMAVGATTNAKVICDLQLAWIDLGADPTVA